MPRNRSRIRTLHRPVDLGAARRATCRACVLAALGGLVGHGAMAGEAAEQTPLAASETPVEEMTVVGERPLTDDDRKRIYEELAKARDLYSRDEIDAALPYLLNTAKHGFKDSQARVGHIYLRGLGEVAHDSEQAVGWLGVASSGTTAPSIENYFNRIWQRIPDNYVPHFEEVVEDYRNQYGEKATGVVCRLESSARSYLKRLHCYFEGDLPIPVREAMREYGEYRDAISEAELRHQEAQWEMEQELRQQDNLATP